MDTAPIIAALVGLCVSPVLMVLSVVALSVMFRKMAAA